MGLLESDMVRAPLLPIDPDGRAAMAVMLRGLGLLETGGGRIAGRRGLARGRGMTAEVELAPTGADGVDRATAGAAVEPGRILDDLEAGRLRAAEPDPAAPDGWRVRPEVKAAILACFADRTTRRLDGRAADVPRSGGGPAARRTWPAARGGSSRAARPSGAAPTWRAASS